MTNIVGTATVLITIMLTTLSLALPPYQPPVDLSSLIDHLSSYTWIPCQVQLPGYDEIDNRGINETRMFNSLQQSTGDYRDGM